MDLESIRQEINQIDDQIVKLLEERMHLVEGVALIRRLQGNRFQIPREEVSIFEKVRNRVEDKRYQETIVVTFFGHTQTFA